MKEKLKKILTVVVGIIILTASIICSTYMLRGYTILCGFYALEKKSVDVVFVGTSVTFSAFMPMEAWKEYGIVAYDYCTNVQFENTLRYSLVDIQRTQKPKVIMLDVAPFLYEHNAGNKSWDKDKRELFIKYNLDSRKYRWDRFLLVNEINKDANGAFSDYWYYFFDITRYHSNKFTPKRIFNTEKDLLRGYRWLPHNGGEIFSVSKMVKDDGCMVQLNEREQYYFDKLLETCKKINSNIIFYCAPIYFSEVNHFGKKNYLKDYVEQNGFKFKDFSGDIEKIGLDYKTDFWSHDHFDSFGAEKVTKLFCEYLKNNFNIPDRRNDERFSGLYRDYEEWKKIKAQYEEVDKTK